MSPCNTSYSTSVPPRKTVPADVTKPMSDWEVSVPAPIKLENDDDEVIWNLTQVIKSFSPKEVEAVTLEFSGGPLGHKAELGPFSSITFNPGAIELTAKKRNQFYGDCYRYHFLVRLKGVGIPEKVIPTNARIDNVAPPCDRNQNAIIPPQRTVPVQVLQRGSEWKVSEDPIKLENDGDVVIWYLQGLANDFLLKTSKNVVDVKLHFYHGPKTFQYDLGPFSSITFDSATKELTAKSRNSLYGPCYLYYLLVYLEGSLQTPATVHLIDPQIDNVMPPPKPPGTDYPDPDGKP